MTNQEAIEIITNAVQTKNMTIEQDKALAIVQEALAKLKHWQEINENLRTQLKTAQETIHQLRESNVQEVVRCKDCYNCEILDDTHYCSHFNKNVDKNDYCSYGG